MKIHISIIKLSLILGLTKAFAPHRAFVHHRPPLYMSSHQDLYDAEEEAVFDAHDLSDPGMEAAAMERYVWRKDGVCKF